MKKLVLFFSIFLLLIGCSNESGVLTPFEQIKYEHIAYNSLSDQAKETILGNWRDARVVKGTYQQTNCYHTLIINSEQRLCFGLIDRNRELIVNQILIGVIFNTNDDALLGPIIVIIEYESEAVIGRVPRF